MRIDDAPDFARRGYMLDVSRCKVPAMQELKRTVDSLSALRYNELQLYMEHSFAFAGDERVWFDSSPLTPAEIMELDRYCRSRFIELVPNLNSFGHLGRWLCLGEYRGLAESPEPWYFEAWDAWYQATLAPGKEALDFIDRLYAEFLPNFTSGMLNIGCDETAEKPFKHRRIGNDMKGLVGDEETLKEAPHGTREEPWDRTACERAKRVITPSAVPSGNGLNEGVELAGSLVLLLLLLGGRIDIHEGQSDIGLGHDDRGKELWINTLGAQMGQRAC